MTWIGPGEALSPHTDQGVACHADQHDDIRESGYQETTDGHPLP